MFGGNGTVISYFMVEIDNWLQDHTRLPGEFIVAYLKLFMKIQNVRVEITQHISIAHGSVAPQQAVSANLRSWSEILNQCTAANGGKHILEVGIGHGEFIAVALEMGYDIEAVELLEEVAQKVSNCLDFPIWCSDFLKFETDKKYDSIFMGDVIEHVMSPETALRKVYDLLEDDGILWLSTPNYKSSFSRLQREDYVMWLEPYHLTFFSYEGLRQLCEKVGFEIMEYTVSNRYLGCMELFLRKKK